MTKTVFNIAILGMGPRNTSTFSYFIKKNAAQYFQVTNVEDADVSIVDFDAETGVKQWRRSQLNSKPTIILSSVNPQKPNSVWVEKPINTAAMTKAIGDLLKLINKLHEADYQSEEKNTVDSSNEQQTSIKPSAQKSTAETLNNSAPKKAVGYQNDFNEGQSSTLNLSQKSIIECCGSQIDGDVRSASFRKQVSYDPSLGLLKPLQNAIALARTENKTVKLRGARISFVVMAGGEQAFIDLDSHLLRHICAAPLQSQPVIEVLPISRAESAQQYPQEHRNIHASSTVLWQIALWTSRGRLPIDIAPDKPLKITAWPNFTRLTITPHAIAMASVWIRTSVSPLQLAEQMDIPQRYVFALISAMSAVDLIQQDALQQEPVATSWRKPQGFLNNILRSLKMG